MLAKKTAQVAKTKEQVAKTKEQVAKTKEQLAAAQEREASTKRQLNEIKIKYDSSQPKTTSITGWTTDVTMKDACATLPAVVYSRVAGHLKTIPHIHDEGTQAISVYTTSVYDPINKGLRAGLPAYHLFAALMITGMNKRPAVEDVSWRGTQLFTTDPLLHDITDGGTVSLLSFTSASKALKEAHKFMGEMVLPGKVKMLFCISGPGRSIEDISAFKEEREVLHPPGKYKVLTFREVEHFLMVHLKWEGH